uniref:Insulin-like growth factor binding protein 2b n=1 Tax=Erpetoichthys calabaricus TaxID=27687 RepID=A0A8C4SYJ1_ERPCA
MKMLYISCSLVLVWLSLPGSSFGEVVFRCPSCTAERLASCPLPVTLCTEIVREPGCGCCPVCARDQGESCGVYTPRCSSGLRCYPEPGSELPLQELVQGNGRCGRRDDRENKGSYEHGMDTGTVFPPTRHPGWTGSPAVRHNVYIKTKSTMLYKYMFCIIPQSLCQQELDQVLEKISMMHLHDDKGPLEHLYTLNIPNCDRRGLYNMKQCKMSVNGQRGECWCVNPETGLQIPGSPIIRGDPECHRYQAGLEVDGSLGIQK